MTRSKSEQVKMGLFAVIAFGLVACLLYGVGAGLRCDIGILLNPLAEQCGLRYEDVSLCIAVMQIVFGGTQPFFGILASRTSNRFVLLSGVGLMSCSIVGMLLARSFAALMFSLGILFGCGGGALAFGMILTSAIHFVGKKNAMIISGMLNAASGMVGFVLSPMLQNLLNAGGLPLTMTVMIVVVAVMAGPVLAVTSRDPQKGLRARRVMREKRREGGAAAAESSVAADEKHITSATEHAEQVADALDAGGQDTDSARDHDTAVAAEQPAPSDRLDLAFFKEAFHNRTYLLLIAGFSTCGFHMVIIESHLFSQFVLYGIEKTAASWAFSVYGIATILGALLSGYLSTRLHKGHLLGFYYGFRTVWTAIYLLLLPKNLFTAILFATGLGMTGDATVSPTSGLVGEHFKLHQVATLIGILFFCHQVGAFLSAWLGGILLSVTGGYEAIWIIDMATCAFASIMSLRIR